MIIQHNISALNSHRQLGNNNNSVSKNLEKLSSGFRINRAGDDAAGLAISEKMRAQIRGLETASKNAKDGISLVQTAEGALTEVHSMLNRMVELATQASNGTYQNEDRANLQAEVNSLNAEINRIAQGTNFNGINLLDGNIGGRTNTVADHTFKVSGGNLDPTSTQTFEFTAGGTGIQAGSTLELGTAVNGVTFALESTSGNGTGGSLVFKAQIDVTGLTDAERIAAQEYQNMSVTISNTVNLDDTTSGAFNTFTGDSLSLQVGDTNDAFQKVNVDIGNMNTASLGIDAISIATELDAGNAITAIKTAISTVSTTRGNLGAIQNRLEHTINNLGVTTENMTAAESRIRDVDMAKEMMDYTKNNILTQAAQAMLAQANQTPQGVLQLLR